MTHASRWTAVLLVMGFGVSAQAGNRAPTECDTAATKVAGSIKEEPHPLAGDKALVKDVTTRTSQLVSVIQEAFPGTKGFNASFTRGINGTPFVKGGPQKYGIRMLFFRYGCNHDTQKTQLNDGSLDATLELTANYPGNLSAKEYGGGYPGPDLFDRIERLKIGDKEHNVYITQPIIGRWKGVTAYGDKFFDDAPAQQYNERGHVSLYLSRKGESPFRPVTRREYLQALLLKLDDDHAQEVARTSKRANNAEQKELADGHHQQRKDFVTKLLNGPDLDRPALFKNGSVNVNGSNIGGGKLQFNDHFFADDEKGASEVLIANHEYWRTNGPKTPPQFFTLTFGYNRDSLGASPIATQLRENFPLDKLQAMIDQ